MQSGLYERATGIEPASSAWKAGVLPLNYARGSIRVAEQCPKAAATIHVACHSLVPDGTASVSVFV